LKFSFRIGEKEGFEFPKSLPAEVKEIKNKNAIDLYPKYFEAAYEKTKSFLISKPSWYGRLASLSEIRCRADDDNKIICSYTPRIIFTTCNKKPVTFLEKNERFKSSPQADSVSAKKDLANKLREVDFSDWVEGIKGVK